MNDKRKNRVLEYLHKLVHIPSPTGYTDQVVHSLGGILSDFGMEYSVHRRGAIRTSLKGKSSKSRRAIATHLDTLGAMVREIKSSGRLQITPIGTWSPRFAEGARVTVLSDQGTYRGTVLPLKASGHIFGDEVDSQVCTWDNVEIRLDDIVQSDQDCRNRGIDVGNFVAFDPQYETSYSGFINSRHLDDKAGVACVLTVIHELLEENIKPEIDVSFLFTVTEETGSGGSIMLHADVGELVAIDNATVGPGQNSDEFGVTIGMADLSGPYDYHLARNLVDICRKHYLNYRRDVFRHYRTDLAAAVQAGNDTRTALICFGVDASHGYERTHISSLLNVAELTKQYIMSPALFERDKDLQSDSLKDFPYQPNRDYGREDQSSQTQK